jgi:ferric-dicitrate binding protein FerR (iron transport regulator)
MMESNFESKPNQPQSPLNPHSDLDSTQQSRFELLSAYLDGEVSPQECKQIHHWLETDPATKQAYLRLLRLRQNLQDLPSPEPTSTTDLTNQVFDRIEQQRRKAVIWGGGAVAILCLGILDLFPVKPNFVTHLAKNPQVELEGEPLMVAINEPPVEIPKGLIAPPEASEILSTVTEQQ